MAKFSITQPHFMFVWNEFIHYTTFRLLSEVCERDGTRCGWRGLWRPWERQIKHFERRKRATHTKWRGRCGTTLSPLNTLSGTHTTVLLFRLSEVTRDARW
jgi:hypothetical protein